MTGCYQKLCTHPQKTAIVPMYHSRTPLLCDSYSLPNLYANQAHLNTALSLLIQQSGRVDTVRTRHDPVHVRDGVHGLTSLPGSQAWVPVLQQSVDVVGREGEKFRAHPVRLVARTLVHAWVSVFRATCDAGGQGPGKRRLHEDMCMYT